MQLLQDEEEIAILKKVTEELRIMKKDADGSEFWMGKTEKENLKKAKVFIKNLEMLTDLCVFNPNRVIEVDDKKKKKKADDHVEGEDEGEEDEFEFMDLSEMQQEWDNEDPQVCDDN